jgi:hypothetical protein
MGTRTITHLVAGKVEVDVAGPGTVDLLLVVEKTMIANSIIPIGQYDCEADALADLEEQQRILPQTAPAAAATAKARYWRITSSAPGERLLPIRASDMAGSDVIGYASTREHARVVAGREVAYRADGFGPDGEESWVRL